MQVRDLLDVPLTQDNVVPMAIQQLLREELNTATDWEKTESLLLRAIANLPDQLTLKVALYKLYAYSNHFDESLKLINQVLEQASATASFCNDWRQLTPQSATWQPATGAVRLYLYSLKAKGFVSLRRGELNLAHEVLKKLLELDPEDQVGGSVVLDMAKRLCETA